jgi:two-component system, OmpR family, phosphate regulon response regulator OmpR
MPELKTRILVVDDDQRLRDLLVRYLGGEGYEVRAVADAAAMDKQLARERHDLVVLDLMLPGEDGLAICRRLRAQNNAPAIVMLTAKGDDVDRIVGLEMGADDYLPKPFNPRELVARIKAILRRTADTDADDVTELVVGPLKANLRRREAWLDSEPLRLTNAEFVILVTLMRAAGEVVSRETLTRAALGRQLLPDDRSLDTHISNLRKKVAGQNQEGLTIRSVRGSGYVLLPPEG